MNKLYAFSKIICLFLFTFGASHIAKAQIDTIPPKMKGCGDTIKVKTNSTFVLVLPAVSDNMCDSADIMVSSKWGSNGAVNTAVNGLYTLTITAFDTSGNVMRCIRYYLVGNFASNINGINSKIKINTYPNPVNSELKIMVNEADINSQIFIYSSTGQLVYESMIGNNASVDTQAFASGLYSLQIKNNLGVYKQTLLIQH